MNVEERIRGAVDAFRTEHPKKADLLRAIERYESLRARGLLKKESYTLPQLDTLGSADIAANASGDGRS